MTHIDYRLNFSSVSGGKYEVRWRGVLFAVFLSAAVNAGAQARYGSNLAREVVTNETGSYNVPNLLPGTYQVDVKLPGFSTFTARDISVRNLNGFAGS